MHGCNFLKLQRVLADRRAYRSLRKYSLQSLHLVFKQLKSAISATLINQTQTSKIQIGLGVGLAALFGAAAAVATSSSTIGPLPVRSLVTEELNLPKASVVISQVEPVLKVERVQRGDTFASLISRLGVSDSAFTKFVRTSADSRRLMNIKPGRFVAAHIDSQNRITRFDVVIEKTATSATRLIVARDTEGQFQISEDLIELQKQTETRVAEVRSTFFAATDAAGIPDSVAIQVADIFGTEVDFNKELRKGDTLKVAYEMLKLPDSLEQPIAGRVLAVEFVHQGKRFEAQWFERTAGVGEYFSGTGASRKKAFLRSPLEVSRVTSGFTMARLNPVSRSWSAHKGVDLAAPIGTNIRSSGDGTVDFIGKQGGYGNTVVIKHGKRYETLYAHLNEFADLKVGQKVKQGDIIGTVGVTGWSTGPHLHYEFKVDGDQVDPLSAALPISEPLTGAEQKKFQMVSGAYQTKLGQAQNMRAAKFE
jgi:murein DD-endopeptidase MepM/ murein hydrolase activator NlpD